jgi:16S rRNA (guanine527-N7)-methyltransferase
MPPKLGAQLSPAQIASALAPFLAASSLSEAQLAQIQTYINKLLSWNQSVSLTSIEDPLEIATRHFGESIFAASLLPIRLGRLADVGSGAGFPGLPLRILSNTLRVVLLEPNLKKCAFLNDVRGALDMDDVEVSRCRYEEYRSERDAFDFVCARALGGYRPLLRWAKNVLRPHGRVILWLGADDAAAVGRSAGWLWELPTRIPESRKRLILIGRQQT